MTTYDFEGGVAGATASTANTAGSVVAGSGNTVTVDNANPVSGLLALKQVMGTTAASTVIYYSATYPPGGQIGTTFTADRYTDGMVCIKVPVGGFPTVGGYLTLVLFHGTSAGNVTIGRFQVADKSAGVALVRFANAAASATVTILTNLTPYEGTWVAFRFHIDTGTTNANASGEWRFYDTPYADPAAPSVTAVTFSGWDLGSASGTNQPIYRTHIGVQNTLSSAATAFFDYFVIAGTASAGPTWTPPPIAAFPFGILTPTPRYR